MIMKLILPILLIANMSVANKCGSSKEKVMYKETGTVEKYDDALDNIISTDTKAEIIVEGLDWCEGPLWIKKQKMLLFSDVPANTIYKWTEAKGKEVYLKPSGYTSSEPTTSREPGSNGLTLDNDGRLVLSQHGDRRIAKMDAPLSKPLSQFITVADKYQGKRFSSPNDCVYNNQGEVFFTDPPYGLPMQKKDAPPVKEISFNGVYKVKKNGEVVLLVDSISRPNGIAFLPGEKQVLISSSDPMKPIWYKYDVAGDALVNGTIFYNATGHDRKWKGLPDGLKVSKKGIVFASGPGGVYIFDSTGKKLGLIRLEEASSNCALSDDEKTLYVTNDMYVLRIKLK